MKPETENVAGARHTDLLRGRSRAAKAVFLVAMLCLLAGLWFANVALVKNAQIQLLLYILAFYGVARFTLRR
jgi:uncharacterized membrane protein